MPKAGRRRDSELLDNPHKVQKPQKRAAPDVLDRGFPAVRLGGSRFHALGAAFCETSCDTEPVPRHSCCGHWLLIDYLLGLQYGAENLWRNEGFFNLAAADVLEVVDIDCVVICKLESMDLGHLLRGSHQDLGGLVLEPFLFEEFPERLARRPYDLRL